MDKYEEEEEMRGKPIKAVVANNSSSSSVIRPFIEGGLAGVLATSTSYMVEKYWYRCFGCCLSADHPAPISPNQRATPQYQYYVFFKKLPAMLLIEATYTTARLGSFEILKQRLEAANCGRPLSLFQEGSCGMTAGAIGALFGSPIYLASRRIEANANLMAPQQSYSKNLLLDFCHTARDKGVLAMWKGGGYYTAWAMALNTGMFATYGRSVGYFKESFGLNDYYAQMSGAFVSGLSASACSLPCTNTYSIMELMQAKANEKYQCTGFLDCALKSLKVGGLKIFYRGFLEHYYRTGPHVMMTLVYLEAIPDIRKYLT